MILDDFANVSHYKKLGYLFEKAFDFIDQVDLKNMPLGRHEIEGDNLFVILMEYETKEIKDGIMENHRKYTDIQYMIQGEELMALKTFRGEIPTTPYDEAKEAAFYETSYDSLVKVREGQFAIFFPQDLHMPSLKVDRSTRVLKAVFKVRNNAD